MNKLEQFIAVYEPQSGMRVGFRLMLDEIISEIKNKSEHEIIGMRDYFAAKALPPLLQDYLKSMDWEIDVPMEHFSMATKVAYQIADEMIKARK